MTRHRGTVKWFNESKGYGFITNNDRDYFVHIKAIKDKVVPVQGQHVTFIPKPGTKGEQAGDVEVIEADGNR
jgi:CspA family cold shock protein